MNDHNRGAHYGILCPILILHRINNEIAECLTGKFMTIKCNFLPVLIGVYILSCVALSAADNGKVAFDIRYYDKTIYYVNRNNVNLKLTITNNSADTFNFKVADLRGYSIDFEVKTQANTFLPHSEKYTLEKRVNQPVLYRAVSLEPGEDYGFVVDLSDFIELGQPGLFTVQAVFYPDLIVSKSGSALRSNLLMLNMRPPIASKEMEAAIEAETGKALEREAIAPDEVVRYMLTARQKSQWEKFFLYVDLEKLYQRNPTREARYKRMSQEERLAAIEGFRRDLMQESVEQDVLLIPRTFEIVETAYKAANGTVKVLERFAYPDYTEKKRFTYYLEKQDRYWIVTDYDVENLGTE